MPKPHTLASILDKAAMLLIVAGVACLGVFFAAKIDARVASNSAGNAFAEYRSISIEQGPDQTLWSPAQRKRFAEAASAYGALPPAMIRIPSIAMTVPVYGGTTDLELNRGAGWIEGTSVLGGPGNTGIAAHRDSFFRPLKDLQPGELVHLDTADGTYTYRVSDISIVDPAAVHVLESGDSAALTLVTCYPFYFVGEAPQRYIIRAELERRHEPMAKIVDYEMAFKTEEKRRKSE